jgi:hypothetical protein
VAQKFMWYTFALILAFLVLTRWQAVNSLLGTGGGIYLRGVGVLQGRELGAGGNVGGIAR